MKKLPIVWLLLTSSVVAAEPSKEAIFSCLLGRSISPQTSLVEFAGNEILTQDNYQPGYEASYYFQVEGIDIGFAQNGKKVALIYDGSLYSLKNARLVLGTKVKPSSFAPDLADWSQVRDRSGEYLCVSFNFEGLGRSGSFQYVRGGYLLSLSNEKRSRELFFVTADTSRYAGKEASGNAPASPAGEK